MGTGSFPGVKRPGRGVDYHLLLAPRLKKEYSYTSTPPLGLRGLFYGKLYLYLYLHRAPRLRMSGAVLLLLLYAFMVWTGITLTLPHGNRQNNMSAVPALGLLVEEV
jgi:membrane associated rhomboid family serine protease